jgi:uncharacterized protein (TIGR02186 family)
VRALGALVLLLASSGAAAAETLVTSVSTPRVVIQSNFSGADIVIFGGIGQDGPLTTHGRYDIVVTVRGPAGPLSVREKERRAGIWINSDRRRYKDVPSFLALASSRPIGEITSPEMIRQYGLSLDTAMDPAGAGTRSAETRRFRDALIRLKAGSGLFIERPKGVIFLNDELFRATVPLPANVPLGIYQVETRLLIDGVVVTGQRASLEVIKSGFENQVAEWATERAGLYGVATCLIALALGWLATVVFRRD